MNPKKMMQQVQQMQAAMQQRMNELQVEGSAGGGMVKATMNGQKELLGVVIDKEAVDPNDVEMLHRLDDRIYPHSPSIRQAAVFTALPRILSAAPTIASHFLNRAWAARGTPRRRPLRRPRLRSGSLRARRDWSLFRSRSRRQRGRSRSSGHR